MKKEKEREIFRGEFCFAPSQQKSTRCNCGFTDAAISPRSKSVTQFRDTFLAFAIARARSSIVYVPLYVSPCTFSPTSKSRLYFRPEVSLLEDRLPRRFRSWIFHISRTVKQEKEEEEKESTFLKRSNIRRTVLSAALAVTDFTKCPRVRDNAHTETD